MPPGQGFLFGHGDHGGDRLPEIVGHPVALRQRPLVEDRRRELLADQRYEREHEQRAGCGPGDELGEPPVDAQHDQRGQQPPEQQQAPGCPHGRRSGMVSAAWSRQNDSFGVWWRWAASVRRMAHHSHTSANTSAPITASAASTPTMVARITSRLMLVLLYQPPA